MTDDIQSMESLDGLTVEVADVEVERTRTIFIIEGDSRVDRIVSKNGVLTFVKDTEAGE